MGEKPPSTDQLRAAIDAGRTGDKVAWPDPAVAPLGTDDEAAGQPAPPIAVDRAMRLETARAPDDDRPRGWAALAAGLVVAIAIIVAALWLLS